MSDELRTLDAPAVRALMSSDSPPVLLDVLPDESFEELRLPGARNACIYEMAFPEKAAGVLGSHTTAVVVYGSGPSRSEALFAAERLKSLGYEDVCVFAGGREAWQEAGYELEGSRAGERWQEDHAPELPDGTFSLDPDRGTVDWIGRNIGNRHFGSLRLASGSLEIRNGRPVQAEFAVDMTSITVEDIAEEGPRNMLVAHLEADDFFSTARFPTATFRSTALTPLQGALPGVPNTRVEGTFTLRGRTEPLAFDATVLPKDGELVLEAHFDFDRTRWGIVYGSSRHFARLGMHIVDDAISLQIRAVAR